MWFLKTINETLKELDVDPAIGLTEAAAAERLEKYGPNKLTADKKKSIIQLFFAQLNDWLIYVLLLAVVITAFLGEYTDGVIILLIVILNAVLGVAQEVKASKAIEALQKLASPRAVVRRGGEVKEVDSEALVPGDIVILDAGRYVSADIRFIETANLQIEESALTGESVPTHKNAAEVLTDKATPLGDQVNCGFMSTLVTYGRGTAVVTGTAMNTEVGKIANLIQTEKTDKTPLEKRLDQLGKVLGMMAIGICVLMFGIAVLQGRDIAEMFLTSVSLAVAAIPEGLAAIVAVVLSIGVTSMSKQNAIIKKLPAVETLGSVNVICSDKTGTLTQNKMTVVHCITAGGEAEIERGTHNNASSEAAMLAEGMVLCSDATSEAGENTGDPTEIALLLFADDLGIQRKTLITDNPRVDEFAFDSDRKLMSTLIKNDKGFTVYTKGALDNLLNICTHVRIGNDEVPITEEHKAHFSDGMQRLSDRALRTLGMAYKQSKTAVAPEQMEENLVLVGLVGMIDPPRAEVRDSIAQAEKAGITTIMITGDHKNTAFAIAHELGIAGSLNQAITGKEIDALGEEEFNHAIQNYRVFSRVSPEHKVKIVRALKAAGNIVSMTGDGVNDAPSLNAADIGVAMGITGTDVAKGASAMILMDDNFATIVSAIESGRNIYNNIKKSIVYLLTCNLGEVTAMFTAILMGWDAPLIATQLLWINLITDSLPAIALGMDPSDPDVMNEKPRPPKEGFFAQGTAVQAILGGLLIGVLTIGAFWFGYAEHGFSPFAKGVPEHVIQYARSMAFMVLVSTQLFFSFSIRNNKKTIFKLGVFSNGLLVWGVIIGFLLQLAVMLIPVLEASFGVQALSIQDWGLVIFLGMIPMLVNEIRKKLFGKYIERS